MINVDISNIWGEISLPDLLAAEKEVFDAHMALTEGTGADGDFLGWMDLPVAGSSEEIDRIVAAAERIRESSDVFIVIGIGGSCLSSRAAISLLQGPNRNYGGCKGNPQILYAGNSLSTRQWNGLMKQLEGKDFSLCVISESGADIEPAIAFRNLRWILERKYGTDEAKKRIFAITGGETGTLRQMAEEAGWESFAIRANVSGGFSALSPAGLLPMAAAGIDILAVLRGACEAKESYDLRSFENPVWLYAAVRNLLYRNGKTIEILESFEPGFSGMGRWWQQLFGGSEGKEGKGIFPATAELTMDLHSLGQLIQEGERNLFETLVLFDAPEQKMVIGEDVKDLDGLNYLAGKTLAFVQEQACQAVVEAHADGGVPVISVDCGELTEETLGGLFWFFQLSCCLSAYMLGVSPFKQTAAEVYKKTMYELLGRPVEESV